MKVLKKEENEGKLLDVKQKIRLSNHLQISKE